MIEPLEARIAPATLVSPTTVTFQDKNGDTATVTISKPLFTMGVVNKVFTFDTGSVNGSNSTEQQLETLDLRWLGHAASGMDVSITVPQVNNGPVNVGYINSSANDLGTVTVDGDLGRIAAGDFVFNKLGLVSLTVNSIGAQGTATQAAGGNLNTLISGKVGSITVNGDIDNASIGIGGGRHGFLETLTVTGSVNGGAAAYSGSIRTQGGIGTVEVDGSINGGAGLSSGVIGTAGALGSVTVEGSLIGAGGAFSGAILSTGAMGAVRIDGDIVGGTGANSGQVGTASTLASVVVSSSVQGGAGLLSGTILARRSITSVTITNGLVGGTGQSSGQVGTGANIGTITIGSDVPDLGIVPSKSILSPNDGTFQGIETGSGPFSGEVAAAGTITSVMINGFVNGAFTSISTERPALQPVTGSPTISAGGNIENVSITEDVFNAEITSAASLGPVTILGSAYGGTEIHAHVDIGSLTINDGSEFFTPGLQPNQVRPLSNFGLGVSDITVIADTGSIGNISIGGALDGEGIVSSIFRAAGDIGNIYVQIFSPFIGGTAIDNSGFDAGGNIGSITSTFGSIQNSVFIAGINLGSKFAIASPGTFNNTVAAGLGFGSSKSKVGSYIGDITVTAAEGELTADVLIQDSTFLAGVHGPGADKTFGTADDVIAPFSFIGTVSSAGGFNGAFLESALVGLDVPTTGATIVTPA